MERRDFIRTSCKLCIGITAAALPSILTSCNPLPIYNTTVENKKISVPLIQFATTAFVIVRCKNLDYDIAVIKDQEADYKSFYMRCTHADNPVDYDGNEFKCTLHGSRFSRAGDVKKGPAEKPLLTLLTTVKEDQLLIHTGG